MSKAHWKQTTSARPAFLRIDAPPGFNTQKMWFKMHYLATAEAQKPPLMSFAGNKAFHEQCRTETKSALNEENVTKNDLDAT